MEHMKNATLYSNNPIRKVCTSLIHQFEKSVWNAGIYYYYQIRYRL